MKAQQVCSFAGHCRSVIDELQYHLFSLFVVFYHATPFLVVTKMPFFEGSRLAALLSVSIFLSLRTVPLRSSSNPVPVLTSLDRTMPGERSFVFSSISTTSLRIMEENNSRAAFSSGA